MNQRCPPPVAPTWRELPTQLGPSCVVSRAVTPDTPCFGRRNFDKTDHRAVLSLFPLGPEEARNRFSNALRPFPPLSARAKMLLCALSSGIFICSGSVCGQICGRASLPPLHSAENTHDLPLKSKRKQFFRLCLVA